VAPRGLLLGEVERAQVPALGRQRREVEPPQRVAVQRVAEVGQLGQVVAGDGGHGSTRGRDPPGRAAQAVDGHGLVAIGAGVEEAVLRAVAVDRLCRTAWRVAAAGGHVAAIADDDLAELPDLGDALNRDTLWRFQLATLAADRWDLSPIDLTADKTARGSGGDA